MDSRHASLEELEKELHDLCQPLTALQCRLELGQMCADEQSLMEAVEGALVETERLFQSVEAMRSRLLRDLGLAGNADDKSGACER